MTTPRPDETAANVKSSQRDARSGSLQRMVRRFVFGDLALNLDDPDAVESFAHEFIRRYRPRHRASGESPSRATPPSPGQCRRYEAGGAQNE